GRAGRGQQRDHRTAGIVGVGAAENRAAAINETTGACGDSIKHGSEIATLLIVLYEGYQHRRQVWSWAKDNVIGPTDDFAHAAVRSVEHSPTSIKNVAKAVWHEAKAFACWTVGAGCSGSNSNSPPPP